MTLLYPTYFPNVASYIVMAKTEKIEFEVQDSYQKQTYRNRCYIYGANGKLGLHIPVQYSQNNRQNTSEILIDNTTNWQSIHWKSIESAYKTSPFFEYYEDDLTSLFTTKKKYLLNFINNYNKSGHKLDSLRSKILFQVAKKVLYNVKK